MKIVQTLISYGLRQVIGDMADKAVEAVVERFTDESAALPKAVSAANEHAWHALQVALAGDSYWEKFKRFAFADATERALRQQMEAILRAIAITSKTQPEQVRSACLNELNHLRQSKAFKSSHFPIAELKRQTAAWKRYTDPKGLIDGAWDAVAAVAKELEKDYAHLSRLLQQRVGDDAPLLAALFSFFLTQEIAKNSALSSTLTFNLVGNLYAAQENAFLEVEKTLAAFGDQIDAILDQLDRIEGGVSRIEGGVSRVEGGVSRVEGGVSEVLEELARLRQEVQALRNAHNMAHGQVKPTHSLSIRSEPEREMVRALLKRFRDMPLEAQKQGPDLLNGLGLLQVGVGDFASAENLFTEAAAHASDNRARAEAEYNRYHAALEGKRYDEALTALREAVNLEGGRFAPFPMDRYRPERILGAGGFGTAFLCHDINWNEQVVVKTLHSAELQRSTDDMLREARVLRLLHHASIIRVRDCGYVDQSAQSRPYFVMDYFPGETLACRVERHGPLPAIDWLAIARAIADAMSAAHTKNVFHRDLKPENVLVLKEGSKWEVRIIDFGLAFTQETVDTIKAAPSLLGQSIAGTVAYAPPEQMGRGGRVGPHSDVFSFGKLSCYALFKTTSPMSRHWKSVGKQLRDFLENCTDEDVDHRLSGFGPVMERLLTLNLAEMKGNERDRQELARLQAEGETKLARLVMDIFERTNGKPDDKDKAAVNELCNRHQLPRDVGQRIANETREAWRKQHQARRAAEETEKRRQEQEAAERRQREEQERQERERADQKAAKKRRQEQEATERRQREEEARQRRELAERIERERFEALKIADAEKLKNSAILAQVDPWGRGDYRTLEEAVAKSPAGAKILVIGTHRLANPLILKKPLTLMGTLAGEGRESSCIICDREEHVLRFSANGLFSASDLTFIHEGNRWADVVEVDQGEVFLVRCRFTGGVRDDTDRQGGNGLWLHGATQGQVEACEMVGNTFSGIFMSEQAQPTLEGNTCQENKESGIIYYIDSKGGIVRNNTCAGNGFGIWIGRQAQPTLEGNTCADNKFSGICVSQEAQPTLEGNTCRGTKASVISSFASGISYCQSASGTARNNTCVGNEKHGIFVSNQAHPTLEANNCRGNLECGIAFFDSTAGTVRNNTCVDNEKDGIYVASTAIPRLADNRCSDNKGCNVNDLRQNAKKTPDVATDAVLPNLPPQPAPPSVSAIAEGHRSTNLNLLCPHCQKMLAVPTKYAGQVMKCPLCSGIFTVPSSPPPTKVEPTKNFTNSLGMEFVLAPAATFWMGERGQQQPFAIPHLFYIGIYPVTQIQWQVLMGDNPSWFSRGGQGADKVRDISDADLKLFPVEQVSWKDVQQFIEKLNTREQDWEWVYRLPTEAEWEYISRGGATSKAECAFDFYFDQPTNDVSSRQANFNGHSSVGGGARGPFLERPSKVGSYQANRLGVFDMHGNVWEWCLDVFDTGASDRVVRGGCWHDNGLGCRAASRFRLVPSYRDSSVGFRLARVPS